eukprot:760647-Hanusia_phi.AAC.7
MTNFPSTARAVRPLSLLSRSDQILLRASSAPSKLTSTIGLKPQACVQAQPARYPAVPGRLLLRGGSQGIPDAFPLDYQQFPRERAMDQPVEDGKYQDRDVTMQSRDFSSRQETFALQDEGGDMPAAGGQRGPRLPPHVRRDQAISGVAILIDL